MAKRIWRIRTTEGLSRRYSIDHLRQMCLNGRIDDTARCTSDDGQSFVDLANMLAHEESAAGGLHPRKVTRLVHRSRSDDRHRTSATEPDTVPDSDEPQRVDSTQDQPGAGQAAPDESQVDVFSLGNAELPTDNALPPEPPPPVAAKRFAPAKQFVPVTQPKPKPALKLPDPPQKASSLVDDPIPEHQPSAVAQAAADALRVEEQSRKAEAPARSQGSIDVADTVPQDTKPEPVADDDRRPARVVFRQPVSLGIILLGIAALGFLIWWSLGLGGTPAQFADLRSFEGYEVSNELSLEALSARTQILAIQMSRINKAILTDESLPADLELADLTTFQKMPLVPYSQRVPSPEQQSKNEELMGHYARLVQEKSPDGRQLDGPTVSLYRSYLQRLIRAVDAKGPDRATALHELSELVKLLYLLELSDITSADANQRQQGLDSLLQATNEGLAVLYVELATGDMRFSELFQLTGSAEQAELVLIRYWHHRAVNRQTAAQWLDEMLKLVDRQQHDRVRKSIAEVDQIQ